MTERPYTDDDLRAVAAQLHAGAARDTDDRIRPTVQRKWSSLDADQIDEACDDLVSLLDSAADTSEWAINLGAAGLTATTSMGWYVTTSGWDIALQLAHRPDIKPELRDEVESAVRLAVERVLSEHGLVPRGLDTTT